MRALAFTLLLLVTYTAVVAQQWHNANSPYFRDVNSVKIFNPTTIVVAGGRLVNDSIETIARSESAGLGWSSFVDRISGWIKSIDFKDEANGIAVGANGKIRNTGNGGDTWINNTFALNRDYNKVYFINAQLAIVVGGKQTTNKQTILKSTDGGNTWNVIRDTSGPWLKSVHFTSALNGVAVGDSGIILKTTDGGNTWANIASPSTRNFNAIYFADANNGIIAGGKFNNDSVRTILKTTNAGDSWTVTTDEPGGWLTDVYFIDSNNGYVTGAETTLLKTTNAGQSWQSQVVPGAFAGEQFNTVRFYGSNFGIIGSRDGYMHIYSGASNPVAYTMGAVITAGDTTHVTINGRVNTFGFPALFSFVVSEDANFTNPSTSMEQAVPSDSLNLSPVKFELTGLALNKRYYYYLQARTFSGTAQGTVQSFYTGIPAYEVRTGEATAVTSNTAILNGAVNRLPGAATLYFDYGLTPALGGQIAAAPAAVSDTLLHLASANLSSLQQGKFYYYRLRAVIGGQDYAGDIRFFYTGRPYTILNTLPITSPTDSACVFNGEISGLGVSGKLSFDYSANGMQFNLHTLFPSPSSINDTGYHFVSGNASPVPGTLYYVRLRVETQLGIFYGDTLVFFSGLPFTVFKTTAATFVNQTSAQLNAAVEKLGVPVDLSFDYGTTKALGTNIAATPANVNDTATHLVTASLTGLQPNTLYYYRLKAVTASGGAALGEIMQLYTGNNIPNWDFQNWTMDTVDIPFPWAILPAGFRRVQGHTGYGLQLNGENLAIMGKFIAGDGGPVFFGGPPMAGRPDSFVAYLNINLVAGDTGWLMIQLTSAGNIVTSEFYPIAGNTAGNFERRAIKINYANGLTPDTVVIGIISTNAFSGKLNPGSSITVDDISFSPPMQNMPNADFETWLTHSQLNLNDWFYIKYVNYEWLQLHKAPMVTQQYFEFPDDYALELRTLDMDSHGNLLEGDVRTKAGFFGESGPSFPVSERHRQLNGFAQFYPGGADTLFVYAYVYKNGVSIGQGELLITDTLDQFTPFTVDIHYMMDTASIPDSALIGINMNNVAGSYALIDKLGFDGFRGGITGVDIKETEAMPGFSLYPNPSANMITVVANTGEDAPLHIFDLAGRCIFTGSMNEGRANIDISGIENGIYIVSVTSGSRQMSARLLVAR